MDKDKMMDQAWENLSKVIDPEIGVSIMELNLVQKLEISDEGLATVEVKMTTPVCPSMLALQLAYDVKNAVASVEGVKKVNVTLLEHYMAEVINENVNQDRPAEESLKS
ncbi:MAG: DUF59 domain-containing protein [Nitrososphaerota archaeon]|jgi:metal-sulfur cluster biosynthetic enzyme|nr:DUF59 domain-containing protein [Nitrososphaerota archaeon]MDG7037894.1 DUF59 domain-containing protein [Nitrososphaerota archaeon]MDG7040519.1 DUF59 domain-containing protein [Nitrososphaerota archaeon]MDG7041969.1 DUF59 domain-containing protein [Nitrososphaerota archaeon]MDG7043675.1 DUF59 domain-containing protein [Nitrososphaerota archaeon]